VSIRVTNLPKAIEFYTKFGFKTVGQAVNGQQFLKSGAHTCWKPLILLVEDPSMPPRQNSYDIGMTRLCLYTENVDMDVEDLKSKGLETIYPVANDTIAKIAAYKDPDNFVIYIIQFKHVIGLICKYFRYKFEIAQPWMFHWTINVKDSVKVNAMLEKIGFTALSDQNKNQVGEGLLPAFGLKGEHTVIEHIRLQNFPNDHFEATTMEWVLPESKKTGHELSNSMCISVDKAKEALEIAKGAGMLIQGKVRTTTLPFHGEVKVGTAYLEEDSNRIDFIEF
jgi:catechol 2,3-dioxygenase-like lactoylglutathione lyase family enzyme